MRLLILGGTTEATRLASVLAARADIAPTLSLAGRTQQPAVSPIPTRIGGFGGAEGLAAYLDEAGIEAVVDATHPFAARISGNAVTACAQAQVPLVAFSRPEWRAGPDDRWTIVPTIPAAVERLGDECPQRIFLTTGRLDIAMFRGAPQHHYLIRTIDAPDPAISPPGATFVLDRGPFRTEDELALLRSHAIDWLVSKNSGGAASAAKLEAARRLKLPVLMIARPAILHRPILEDLESVLGWIELHRVTR